MITNNTSKFIQNNVNNDLNNEFEKNKIIPMDIDTIGKIISQKINNIQIINDELIEELVNGITLFCQNHNKSIKDWFDDDYSNDLEVFKNNNNKYSEIIKKFNSNSFLLINES